MSPSRSKPGQIPELVIDGAIARIELRRPGQHNRLDPGDVEILAQSLSRIERDEQVRVVVLTGSGDTTFSSGYNINALIDHLNDDFEHLLNAFEQLRVPTICVLNGSVYGGATDLALCCDFRIGRTGIRMFMPAAKMGLHFYADGLRRYVAQLGLSQAKKLFLTAQAIDAEEMKRIGFLTELVDPDALQQTVHTYIDAILACESAVLADMKRHLGSLALGAFDAGQAQADYKASLRSPVLAQRLKMAMRRAE